MLETWKQNKTKLILVLQEGDFTYSLYGFILDFSEKEITFDDDRKGIQIINRNFIIKLREAK